MSNFSNQQFDQRKNLSISLGKRAYYMEEKFIQVDGNKIRYLESGGSHENITLIHGLGASAERWEFVIPFLQKKYRLIIPDLIGFGTSDKPLIDYTMDFFSDFLGKFFKEIKLEKTHLVGSSLGGQICAEYASQNPTAISKLVLVSPSGIMKQSTPALDAYVMAALYPNEEGAVNAFQMMTGTSKKINPRIARQFTERMKQENAKMAFMSTLLGLKNADVISTKLQLIKNPTLLIWGKEDPVIPISFAQEFISNLENSQFYEMAGCGHTPYVDEPEKFSKIVLEFLKS